MEEDIEGRGQAARAACRAQLQRRADVGRLQAPALGRVACARRAHRHLGNVEARHVRRAQVAPEVQIEARPEAQLQHARAGERDALRLQRAQEHTPPDAVGPAIEGQPHARVSYTGEGEIFFETLVPIACGTIFERGGWSADGRGRAGLAPFALFTLGTHGAQSEKIET